MRLLGLSVFFLLLAVFFSGQVQAEFQAEAQVKEAQAKGEYWEYTFRPGDTIWKVARDYTSSVNNWQAIQQLNGIGTGSDRQIQPGQRIKIPVSMLKVQPTPAIVIALSGKVKILRANGNEESAELGSKLYSGDRVSTLSGQNVRIRFADKSELQVFSGSDVVFDKLSFHKNNGMVDTRVHLQRGRVNTWVEKLKPKSRYEIKTPAAITAVRGTQYRLSTESIEFSRAEVTEGLVAVAAGATEVQLKEGFGIVAEKGKPLPEPVKLLEAPKISENQSSVRNSLQLSWDKLEGAMDYRYQLARDEDFNQLLVDSSGNTTRLEKTNLEAGSYYLRVRAVDKFKLEGLDAVRKYIIQPEPERDESIMDVIIPVEVLLL